MLNLLERRIQLRKQSSMDPPKQFMGGGGYNQPSQRQRTRGKGSRGQTQQQAFASTELFDDISTYNSPMPSQNYQVQPHLPHDQTATPQQSHQQPSFPPVQQMLNDNPMAGIAMQYGSQFVPAGKEYVEKKLDHFLSVSKLKYYFGVDTTYVLKKLGLLVFPFAHQDWSLKYDKSEPVAPRYEVNAPDLYIPTMAFVTYVLVCSLILGTQNRFTPEQLGITASSALVWLFIELLVIIMSIYVMGISSQVKYLDLLALCGYKYVGMILALLAGLLFKSFGYYCATAYMSLSISFYLARSLRLIISPDHQGDSMGTSSGNKRRLYILLFISLIQPLLMYFLTRHLNDFDSVSKTKILKG